MLIRQDRSDLVVEMLLSVMPTWIDQMDKRKSNVSPSGDVDVSGDSRGLAINPARPISPRRWTLTARAGRVELLPSLQLREHIPPIS